MKNYFGVTIPSRLEYLANSDCYHYLIHAMEVFLDVLGVEQPIKSHIASEILETARYEPDDKKYEQLVNQLLMKVVPQDTLRNALVERANHLAETLLPYFLPGTVLDYGCGDAKIGVRIQELREGEVTLIDVLQHPDIKQVGVPFLRVEPKSLLPFPTNHFDNVMLITVLHHTDDPVHVLTEALRVLRPGGRILIEESVYGINPEQSSFAPHNELVDQFAALDPPSQFAVNAFFDHLHNRCLCYSPTPSDQMNVPYNFQTPEQWNQVLIELGVEIEGVVVFGIDQPVGPIFHTFHFGRKEIS